MNALVFLGVALALSLIGSLIVLARNRAPRSVDTGIDDFAERMRALSPERDDDSTVQPRPGGRPN